MATLATHPTAQRHERRRHADWKPRLEAIEIIGDDPATWSFRLSDRGTVFELALLRLAYGAELAGEDSRGMILKPRPGLPVPTREALAATLETLRSRRRG